MSQFPPDQSGFIPSGMAANDSPEGEASVSEGGTSFKVEDETKDLLHQELHADGQPRRPMNAFMIFARHRRPTIQKKDPALKTGDISKRLSTEWKNMHESEKRYYTDQAKKLKDNFHERYPDYVYRRKPGKPRKKKGGDVSSPEGVQSDLPSTMKPDQTANLLAAASVASSSSSFINPTTTSEVLQSIPMASSSSQSYSPYRSPYWSQQPPTTSSSFGGSMYPNSRNSSLSGTSTTSSTYQRQPLSSPSFPTMDLGPSPPSSTYNSGFVTSSAPTTNAFGSASTQTYTSLPLPTTTSAAAYAPYFPSFPYGSSTSTSTPFSSSFPSPFPSTYRISYGSSTGYNAPPEPPSTGGNLLNEEKETESFTKS